MHIQGAHIADPDHPFVIVAVPPVVIADRTQAEQTFRFLQTRVVGHPLALVTRDEHGAPTAYYGPSELAVRLLQLPSAAICWNELAIV